MEDDDARAEYEFETSAERAWLRAAEYDPEQDAFEDWENDLGIDP